VGGSQAPWWRNLLKYFLHGIAFSVIFVGLAIFWIVILAVLVMFGSFIGLIIGFILLFLIIGGLNSFLTVRIWDFSTRTGWTSLLTHGVVLFIVLIIVSIPAMVINANIPSLTTTLIMFIVYAFIDGFIARKVADFWEEEFSSTSENEYKPPPSEPERPSRYPRL
jgi:hypothetical protein